MSYPSSLDAPCYSEDFSDTHVVRVVYSRDIRCSHRNFYGYCIRPAYYTEPTGNLLTDVSEEDCPPHYIRNFPKRLHLGLKEVSLGHMQRKAVNRRR